MNLVKPRQIFRGDYDDEEIYDRMHTTVYEGDLYLSTINKNKNTPTGKGWKLLVENYKQVNLVELFQSLTTDELAEVKDILGINEPTE